MADSVKWIRVHGFATKAGTMALRYDNRSHGVLDSASNVHVFAREGEDVKLDLNFFEGTRTFLEALALHECLGGALVDAAQHVLGESVDIDKSLLTPAELENWAYLEKRKRVLATWSNTIDTSLHTLLSVALTRLLREGKWVVEAPSEDSNAFARPANYETERRLTSLAQETHLRSWHDSLCIEGGGTSLVVCFDDNRVRLEFMSEDPDRVARFGEALHLDLDLGEWAAARKIEMLANIERQIAALQAKRAKIVGG